MKSFFFSIVLIVTFCHSQAETPIPEGHCVWYDTCMENPDKEGMLLNCYYQGDAKPLEDPTSLNTLESACPELLEEITDEDGSISTCCSPSSISIMADQLTLLSNVLASCPSCLSNLRKVFCYLACHPRQSNFLNPLHLVTNETTGVQSVYDVDYYVTNQYIYSTYDACDKVYFASISQPALVLLCGPWGEDLCSPERLFDYLGVNEFAPFDIYYQYTDDPVDAYDVNHDMQTFTPFDPDVIPCNTTLEGMHCLCADCSESCPEPPEPIPPHEYQMVGKIRLYEFIIIVIYIVFASAFVILGYWKGLPGRSQEEHGFLSFNHKLTADIDQKLQNFFEKFARYITRFPILVMIIGVIVIGVLSTGITQLKLTTNPVELWASPESRTRKEKEYYDNNFGPFYRTNQIIITSNGFEPINYTIVDDTTGLELNYTFGPVFNDTFMLEVLDLQLQIMNLTGEYTDDDDKEQLITLTDICIKPLYPSYDDCLIESVLNYWQNDEDILTGMMVYPNGTQSFQYLEYLMKCVSNPTYFGSEGSCLGTYGGPVFPYVALGGYLEEGEAITEAPHYEHSTAVIITILGQNHVNEKENEPAMAWEKAFLDFIKDYSNPDMNIAYLSERSIEDEIIRESKSDVSTILISYLVMFAYVSLSLGNYSSDLKRVAIETKITLGLCSVILVFFSVVASVGLCAFLGVESTLIVIEVIPFLVLAVGVDNLFLLVQTLEREEKRPDESVEDRVSRVVGKVGPSILLSACSEAICFFLGALTEMPAVHSFALYAGVALTIDFLLQMTFLVALIVIDEKRQNNNRYDVLCCIQGPKKKNTGTEVDVCYSFFDQIYAPFLLHDVVRACVILIFFGGFFASWAVIPRIDIGLEQDIGFPDDSYLITYFDYMANYLSVGSPVYFVVKENFDYPEVDQQNLICSFSGCNDDSMITQIFVASQSPETSYIATGASSWLDSYLIWVSDDANGSPAMSCCRLDENGNFINSSIDYDLNAKTTCLEEDDFVNGTSRPYPYLFMEFLPYFLIDNPHGNYCPQAGHPSFGTAVVISDRDQNGTTTNDTYVGANYYMAYHTILKVSKDFTAALEMAYDLTDTLTEYLQEESSNPDIEVFPYSIFYVYYEQYLTMSTTAAKCLGVSFVSVFLVMILLTGFDIRGTLINLLTILMITVDIMGFMIPWKIQLNAVSLVNLVMAVGISVEFCSHITHAFVFSSLPTKVERARSALTNTGSSVLSGITLTKFGGIVVLAFASSQVITVFYFRMYLLIVLVGASHGLIFLPVFLSLYGPSLNPYIVKEEKLSNSKKSFKGEKDAISKPTEPEMHQSFRAELSSSLDSPVILQGGTQNKGFLDENSTDLQTNAQQPEKKAKKENEIYSEQNSANL